MTSTGHQRLPLEKLKAWEALGYGMFIHFGMSTFDGDELSAGDKPSTLYNPDRLDVDQWVSIIRDAGMKYAVLTAKHVSGHCLWPTAQTDYHVGTSGNPTDVVEAFVKACEKRGILPGLYYCSWDNHNRFGSLTESDCTKIEREQPFKVGTQPKQPYTTRAYEEFQSAQLEELLTRYGQIAQVWIDIPHALTADYRQRLYQQIVGWQPETVIMMNNGIGNGSELKLHGAWPTDLISIERFLPPSKDGHVVWRDIEGQPYYLPGEVCEPIGREWFYAEHDAPRSDAELLGMYLVTRSRGANLLLDVGPDKHGLIPQATTDALMRLRDNIERFSSLPTSSPSKANPA
ncbi:alpha-L-fucosidase [Ruficoccus sp. ZRK36]|uniref:alpha-L-fucosidase n=1 Tax=Ruficoccus sp. ZRK36 TaxID=2866311 RepID=UPI001C730F5A|nr:alpha-L-fucosidase [Ruficoccus sp. ZRK36]QYY36601.1 alpha-L-fucosidase [Ruficoccus sp. ZRK36]